VVVPVDEPGGDDEGGAGISGWTASHTASATSGSNGRMMGTSTDRRKLRAPGIRPRTTRQAVGQPLTARPPRGEPGNDTLHGGAGTDIVAESPGIDTCTNAETRTGCEAEPPMTTTTTTITTTTIPTVGDSESWACSRSDLLCRYSCSGETGKHDSVVMTLDLIPPASPRSG